MCEPNCQNIFDTFQGISQQRTFVDYDEKKVEKIEEKATSLDSKCKQSTRAIST